MNDLILPQKTLEQRAAELATQLRGEFSLEPGGLDGWVDPQADWYKATLAFGSALGGLQTRRRDGSIADRKVKYLSEWPDRFGVVMDFFIFNSQNQILQGLRSDAVQHSQMWCIPGGHTEDEPGYNLMRTLEYAAEELLDETGLVYSVEELRQNIVHVWQFQGSYHLECGKRFLQIVFALFPDKARIKRELKASTTEMAKLAFVYVQDVLNQKLPQAFPLIQLPVLRWMTAEGGYVQRFRRLQAITAKLKRGQLVGKDDIIFLSQLRAG